MMRKQARAAGWSCVVPVLVLLAGCATPGARGTTPEAAAGPRAGYVPVGGGAGGIRGFTAAGADVRAAGDLWQRVRGGLRLQRPGNTRVEGQARSFAKDRRYLGRLADSARPYLHVVLAEIERRGLPAELALLPQVESRFNPAATSPAAAAGMWQFIPSTGTAMGLHQSPAYDGRRDLLESTRGALDYLEQLHRRLGGDWELAMAAYNCGPGRVESAQAANRARGLPTDFWSLNLPTETENYVPAILAVARLVAAPEHFGLVLPPLPDTPQIEVVIPTGAVDLAHVAQAGGVALGDLQRLNAGLRQGRTQPRADAGVVVPVGTGRQVVAGLPGTRVVAAAVAPGGAVPPGASEQPGGGPAPEEAVGKEVAYQVRADETLGMVARRFGVSVEEIRGWNENASDGISDGERLRLFPRANWPGAGVPVERAAQREPGGDYDGFRPGGGLASAG